MTIVFNNTTYPAGFLGIDDGAAKSTVNLDAASTYSVSVTGNVNAAGDTVTLTYGPDTPGNYPANDPNHPGAAYAGTSITLTASPYDNTGMIEFTGTSVPPGQTTVQTYRYILSNTQVYGNPPPAGHARTTFTADGDNTPTDYNVAAAPCFATGTRIRVIRDGVDADVAVEDLRAGDGAMTATRDVRSIRWIGHRVVDCRNHPRPGDVMPIRIAAHAFGENRPARDLFVSPGHAICVDVLGEVLIPAGLLTNGSTVQQVDVDEVTYWHVELDSHDVILAENLPAESYLDMGNRGFFAEGNVVALNASPDADPALRTHADFCRPFHDGGPFVDVVRAQLNKRAENNGWSLTRDLELHLVIDGQRVDPCVRDMTARFQVPAGAKDVWLVSPTARPCDTWCTSDRRELGLAIAALRIDDGFRTRDIALDGALLCVGFHVVEDGGRRWTSGRARLPAGLWAGWEEDFHLRVELADLPVPRWVAPGAKAAPAERPRLAAVA